MTSFPSSIPGPFVFETVGQVQSGAGFTSKLGEYFHSRGVRRVFLVTDKGVRHACLDEAARVSLREASVGVDLFDEVEPDPPEAVILRAVERARQAGSEAVLGLGGGSSLDTAKLVALLARSPQALETIYGIDRVRGERLPLVLVPTTAGTGSEVTPIAVVTTPSQEKKGVVSSRLLPDMALLDPELTLSLPPAITAATGIDAMVHAIEAFTSRHRKNALSDALALKALELLAGNIEKAVHSGGDRAARTSMLEGSLLAGMAFANAPVAAVHALAYPLGGHYHIPHGLSNALVLPHVLRFNAPAAGEAYARLAVAARPGRAEAESAEVFIGWLGRLGPSLGLPARLRDAGVAEKDLPMLAADAIKIQRLLVNNPREINEIDALGIYREAY